MSTPTYLESRPGEPEEELIERLLQDPSKKEMLQKRLTEEEPTRCGTSSLPPHLTPSGTNQMGSISDRASGQCPAPRRHGGFKSRISGLQLRPTRVLPVCISRPCGHHIRLPLRPTWILVVLLCRSLPAVTVLVCQWTATPQ